jgi:hypothetical protein
VSDGVTRAACVGWIMIRSSARDQQRIVTTLYRIKPEGIA